METRREGAAASKPRTGRAARALRTLLLALAPACASSGGSHERFVALESHRFT